METKFQDYLGFNVEENLEKPFFIKKWGGHYP